MVIYLFIYLFIYIASIKSIRLPPILKLGNIIFSKNFGGNNLGIVIRNGITDSRNKTFGKAVGWVYYIDKNNDYVISSGPLEIIKKHIASPLISMDMKMKIDADDEFDKNRHKKNLSREADEYFRYILEQAGNNPIIQEQLLLARDGFVSVDGGRGHRRKSRRHKKTNHRHKKSRDHKSRRITQRYKNKYL